jgi:serine/threonine protein kinase
MGPFGEPISDAGIARPPGGKYTRKVADTLITDRRSSAPAVYRMIRRLGKGGMAEVFLARQEGVAGFRRLAVVKRLLPQFSSMPNVAEMLLDEARIAAQLSHPNIVQIYELNKEDGQYFIAMEFVDGCDLATLARIERRRKSRIPIRLALRVIAEAAMGLDYAHRQVGLNGLPLNLVHRDVSPHNILCSREGAVKVTDFGIAKAVGKEQVTEVGVVKGKVHYMSPEQYTGGDVDKRSDIFSLGVVLYQLTTGRLPRVSKNGQLNMRQVTEGRIPRPVEIRQDYPEDLDEIVMRALAQNPDDRYQDCASLRDDLLDFARYHDLLAFPNELGDYVNECVPPQPLTEPDPDLNSPAKLKKRSAIAPTATESPRSTEKVSLSELSPNVTAIERRVPAASARSGLVKSPYDRVTDIPIESGRPTLQGGRGDSAPAVLPGEQLTPIHRERQRAPSPVSSPAAGADARVFRLERRRGEDDQRDSAEEAVRLDSSERRRVRDRRVTGPPGSRSTGPQAAVSELDNRSSDVQRDQVYASARPLVVSQRGSWIGVTVALIGVVVLAAGLVLLLDGRRTLFGFTDPGASTNRARSGRDRRAV